MMGKWLVGHLGELQLLLCLLLLHLFTRPLAMRALLLGTLVLGTATAPLLPRRHRGILLLLLELGVLWHFALDHTDLVGLLAFLLFPFSSQGGSSPCCVNGGADFIEGGSLQLPGGVFSLCNDLCNGVKGGENLGKEDEGLDVVCDQIGCILHPGEQAFNLLDGWFGIP